MKPDPFVPDSMSAELEARLKQLLEGELTKPTRPWWRDALAFTVASLVIFGIGVVFFEGAAPGASMLESGALLLVALGAGSAALAPWPQHSSRAWLLGGLVVGTVTVTQAVSISIEPFTQALGCLAWECLASLLPAGVAVMAARHHAPRLSRALVLGWAAGTVSLAVVHLTCPHRDVMHVLGMHVAPVFVVVAVTVLTRRQLQTKSYAP